jgi:bifunctional NMN adenylyltransferase/nudix hydrolase
LPGGFVEPDERIQDSAIRELAEETRLGVSADTLRAALRTVTVFDHPFRSLRGRAITHVHHFVLDDHANISLEAGDDAKEAVWTPISQLAGLEDQMFEDHFVILKRLIRAPILHPMHGR